MVVDFERNAHPVEGAGSVARHFAAVLHGLQHFGSRQQRFSCANEIVGQSAAQLLRRGRGILLIDEIRESEQIGGRIIERDVEVPRVHQLIDNAVHGGEELLQIVSAAALFGDPVERRTQRLHPLAIGDVVVSGIEARHLPIQQQRRARHGNIEQGSIFFSALRLQSDAFASGQRLRHPSRLRQTVGRHHEILQRLSYAPRPLRNRTCARKFRSPRAPDGPDPRCSIHRAKPETSVPEIAAGSGRSESGAWEVRRAEAEGRNVRRRNRWRARQHFRAGFGLDKRRRGSALQGFFQPTGAGNVGPSRWVTRSPIREFPLRNAQSKGMVERRVPGRKLRG